MKSIVRLFVFLCAILMCCSVAFGATIYVKWNSPTDGPGTTWDNAYHTISAAITAASAGDEIQVMGPNQYNGSITINKNITLTGINQPVIYGSSMNTVTISTTATIQGFTIKRITGVVCSGGTPTVKRCTITACSSRAMDISVNAYIIGNKIIGNTPCTGGGVILVTGCSPQIISNLIANNNSSTGAGIACSSTVGSPQTPLIYNNTFANNTATGNGGAIICNLSYPNIRNNIFTGNQAAAGSVLHIYQGLGGGDYAYNSTYNNGSNPFYPTNFNPIGVDGNRNEDPLYIPTGDYRVYHSSPCVNSGNNSYVLGGIDCLGLPRLLGDYVDRGCYEGASATVYNKQVGEWLEWRSKAITANFGTFFYVEAPNRSKGIKVLGSTSGVPGDLATVDGQVVMDGNELALQITAPPIIETGSTSNIPKPLGMNNKFLGGINMGLRVTTWGKVTENATGYFRVDDGYGNPVKVYWSGTFYDVGDYVMVTGISSDACVRATEVVLLLAGDSLLAGGGLEQESMATVAAPVDLSAKIAQMESSLVALQHVIDEATPGLRPILQQLYDRYAAYIENLKAGTDR